MYCVDERKTILPIPKDLTLLTQSQRNLLILPSNCGQIFRTPRNEVDRSALVRKTIEIQLVSQVNLSERFWLTLRVKVLEK